MNQSTSTNLLLIEDNPNDIHFIKSFLEQDTNYQYNITIANRLSESIEVLNIHNIDLILLDLTLPDSQGIQTFIDLYEQFSYIPIIILTGLNDDKLTREAIKLGAQDLLIKDDLSSKILGNSVHNAICRANHSTEVKSKTLFYESLLNSLPIKIVVITPDRSVVFMNNKWKEDCPGKSVMDYFYSSNQDSELQEKFNSQLNRVMNGTQSTSFEFEANQNRQNCLINKIPNSNQIQISIISS